MKKTALTLIMVLLFSVLLIHKVQAENWSAPTPILHSEKIAYGLSISVDGSKIVFSAKVDDAREIFVVNWDGTGLKQITSNLRQNTEPKINADGSKITFMSYLLDYPPDHPLYYGVGPSEVDHKVFVINSDGTGLKVIDGNMGGTHPSISDNGNKIAFSADNQIFTVDFDGKGLKQITNTTNYRAVRPSISSDTSKIAFVATSDDNSELFVINSDGTQLTSLFSTSGDISRPSISDDGNRIAFWAEVDDNHQLYIVNSDGTGLKQLASLLTPPDSRGLADLAISGDGSKIAFTNRTRELFVINSDGTELKQIGTTTADWKYYYRYPSISGDGGKITFSGDNRIHVSAEMDLHDTQETMQIQDIVVVAFLVSAAVTSISLLVYFKKRKR